MALSGAACSSPQLHSDLTDDPQILLRKWTLATHGPFDLGDHGSEYSHPVIVDNTLVFGNRSVGLISIYPSLNQQRWALPIPGGVVSPLAVERGSVYFGGGDGFVYSVDLENGRVNWRYDVRNPNISRPTITDGRVYFTTTDDTVYSLDAGTGKWLWHYRRRSSPAATILGASQPLIDGNEVIAGLSDGFVVALSIEEGQLKRERKIHDGTRFTDVNAHPVLENGTIYVPSYDGSLYGLSRNTLDVLWRYDAGGSKEVSFDQQRLYLPSSEGVIYCLDKVSRKELWKFKLDRGVPTDTVVTDRYVIFGSSHQYFYVLDKLTGKGLYRFDAGVGSGFSGTPVYDVATQRLYVLSSSGNLYAFSVRQPLTRIRPHGTKSPFEFN